MSELKIINGNKNLIICFGGIALKFGGILPFEFLNYLSSNYTETCDLIFYIDDQQCWYHKGINGITNNIDETIIYLNDIIVNYTKIILMGVSAGGYAAILFGSLCNNVNNVISFVPQTILKNPFNKNYGNLNNIINEKTKYFVIGDSNITNIHDLHSIIHCENIQNYQNVELSKIKDCNVKKLRDNGYIKDLIDNIIYE